MSREAGISRLLGLRADMAARAETLDAQRGRFEALADPAAAPRAVSSFNLFQTPEPVAARMAELLSWQIRPGAVILEPSAGLGRLYRAIRDAGHTGPMVLVEESADCCRELYDMTAGDNVTLRQGDFLAIDLDPVDAVIMNPPFKQGRDIKHIRRALELVRPGGRLVSLCYNGARQNEELKPIADQWIELEPGSFRESGTDAQAAVVVFDK